MEYYNTEKANYWSISELVPHKLRCSLYSEWFFTLDAKILNRHRFLFRLFSTSQRRHVWKSSLSKSLEGFSTRQQRMRSLKAVGKWSKRADTIVTEVRSSADPISIETDRGEVSRDHQQHPRLFYPSDGIFVSVDSGKGSDRSWLIEGIVLVPCFPWLKRRKGEEDGTTRWQIARHDPLKTLTWFATLSLPTPWNNNLSPIGSEPDR